MTLLACQIFSTIAHEGSFARTAERLHLTPSAISHSVASMEAECGFPLFTRTKAGVTMTAAAEHLLPDIQRLLSCSESLDQSIARINGMEKGVLRLAAFNSACVTWLPQLLPGFQRQFPGIELQVYQGSYSDIAAWLKNGTVEIGLMSTSSAQELDFEPMYCDPLVCIAPVSFRPRHPGVVTAEELRGQVFVSQRPDTDADIQSYLKKNDLRVNARCYVIDDESTIAMVACGQGVAIMPQLILTRYNNRKDEVCTLRLEPAASRSIGMACRDKNGLSPAARQFWQRVREFAANL
ncbi:LysR family transcriptional regulator [uncultured Gemmiger sp.]|uniref:LysR family transcriptional regulator n=1 Tax=uncultured Gemmiger sp. TaxID=1623490 RepID=UPI0025E9EF84|nr:LysR family transcriptional regulator [uncultured Gemmiger sp.]